MKHIWISCNRIVSCSLRPFNNWISSSQNDNGNLGQSWSKQDNVILVRDLVESRVWTWTGSDILPTMQSRETSFPTKLWRSFRSVKWRESGFDNQSGRGAGFSRRRINPTRLSRCTSQLEFDAKPWFDFVLIRGQSTSILSFTVKDGIGQFQQMTQIESYQWLGWADAQTNIFISQ